MKSYCGGDRVPAGTYWNNVAGESVTIPAEGGRLGGSENDRYVRASLPLVSILGPLAGAAFALFLPFSGVLVLAPFLASKLFGAATPGSATLVEARPLPGVSYLQPVADREPSVEAPDEAGEKILRLAEAIVEQRLRELRER